MIFCSGANFNAKIGVFFGCGILGALNAHIGDFGTPLHCRAIVMDKSIAQRNIADDTVLVVRMEGGSDSLYDIKGIIFVHRHINIVGIKYIVARVVAWILARSAIGFTLEYFSLFLLVRLDSQIIAIDV